MTYTSAAELRAAIRQGPLGAAAVGKDEPLEHVTFGTRHDTPEGQVAMQAMHDEAAHRGAVCRSPKAEMVSRHESDALQRMHDMAVENGAKCSTTAGRSMYAAGPAATFAKDVDDLVASVGRGDLDLRGFTLGMMRADIRDSERQLAEEQQMLDAQRRVNAASQQAHIATLIGLTSVGKAALQRERP